MTGPFILSIPRRYPPTEVVNLNDVSALYWNVREDSGEGASTFPEGIVKNMRGEVVARVSYNARVWAPGEGGDLLHEPGGTWPGDAATIA